MPSPPTLAWSCRAATWLLFAACGCPAAMAGQPVSDLCRQGQRQSPIDIPAPGRPLRQSLQTQYLPAPLHLVHDGHTVRARIANGSHLLLDGQRLVLQQFHFHWPGGDKLQGETFPLAMHFLHKRASGQLVALVVLFRQGASNPALADLLPLMPTRPGTERRLPEVLFDPGRLLPAASAHFAYDGSLTAPPCTEGVPWLVMKQPLAASAEQLRQMATMFPTNARPVQPLRGRVVTESP
jgi:carbonic anhydrase